MLYVSLLNKSTLFRSSGGGGGCYFIISYYFCCCYSPSLIDKFICNFNGIKLLITSHQISLDIVKCCFFVHLSSFIICFYDIWLIFVWLPYPFGFVGRSGRSSSASSRSANTGRDRSSKKSKCLPFAFSRFSGVVFIYLF